MLGALVAHVVVLLVLDLFLPCQQRRKCVIVLVSNAFLYPDQVYLLFPASRAGRAVHPTSSNFFIFAKACTEIIFGVSVYVCLLRCSATVVRVALNTPLGDNLMNIRGRVYRSVGNRIKHHYTLLSRRSGNQRVRSNNFREVFAGAVSVVDRCAATAE